MQSLLVFVTVYYQSALKAIARSKNEYECGRLVPVNFIHGNVLRQKLPTNRISSFQGCRVPSQQIRHMLSQSLSHQLNTIARRIWNSGWYFPTRAIRRMTPSKFKQRVYLITLSRRNPAASLTLNRSKTRPSRDFRCFRRKIPTPVSHAHHKKMAVMAFPLKPPTSHFSPV